MSGPAFAGQQPASSPEEKSANRLAEQAVGRDHHAATRPHQQPLWADPPAVQSLRSTVGRLSGVSVDDVGVDTSPAGAAAAQQAGSIAFARGRQVNVDPAAAERASSSPRFIVAHDLAHVALGHTRVPGAVHRFGSAQEVEAWVRNPPSARMQASLEGLDFAPLETAVFAVPDQQLSPAALVLARLAGTAYDPAWARECMESLSLTWDFRGQPQESVGYFRLRPGGAVVVLAFLTARIGDAVVITPHQRALVAAAEALNPVPPEILGAQRQRAAGSADPAAGGSDILAAQQAILNELATMWWGRTQAYVQAFLVWKADPTDKHLKDAASALDDLLSEFEPYSAVLRIVHDDPALQTLPEWSLLWPTSREGQRPGVDQVVAAEAVAFTQYAASQPGELITRARDDAAARRSLLEGYGAFRTRIPARREGDQQVTTTPSPYNAPPLPVTLSSYPRIDPPLYAAATGVTTTFFANIGFENLLEALQQTFGGWEYQWEALRVPGDDLANLGIMSIPPEPPPGWEAVQEDLARDFRYAQADLQRIGWIARLTSALGAPGVSAETLVGANLVMDAAGTFISSLNRSLTGPSSEFDVRFRKEGLHLIRLRVGPRPADEAKVAQFRRAPSIAWMPVFARPPRALGEERLQLEVAARSQAFERYEELREMLEPVSHEDQTELELEFADLRLGLFGATLEILQDQRGRLDQQRLRIENGTATPADRATGLTGLRERIDQLDQLIEMRQDRAGTLGPSALRLPATLVKDSDGSVVSLTIEAAQVSASPQRWYVSDLTTPRSGQAEAEGKGKLAPGHPAEDSILAALKEILESPSGYGKGHLSVWFSAPVSGPPGVTSGQMLGTRIETDDLGIVMHGIESLSTLISIGAVVAAPFTVGASLALLMPVGIVGAVPSAYRLMHRAEMGTLRFDLETAMQVVDIAGAALQVGEIGAGIRAAASAGTRAGLRWAVVEGSLWIAGVGANGLGMVVMGVGLVDQLRSLEGLPPGLKAARMTEIIGNAMLTFGIQAGAHLASRAHLQSVHQSVETAAAGADRPGALRPTTRGEAPPPVAGRPQGRTEPPRHLAQAVPTEVLRTTPLDVDPALKGTTVQVEYRIGDNGRVDPSSIRMVASPHATADDIALHVEAARTLHAYAGLLGAVHEGIESLRGITGSRRSAEQGSAAWEAQLEFAKLNDIIRARLARVATLSVDEARAAELATDLENLRSQLADAMRILAGDDAGAPRGFIAAQSPEQRRTANRETAVSRNVATVTIASDGTVSVHEPSATHDDPAPGHTFVENQGRVYLRPVKGTESVLETMEYGGRWYVIPSAGPTMTQADHLNNIRAQLDSYPLPLPGHVYRPAGEGWQLRHDGVSPEPAQRIDTENGRPVRGPQGEYRYRPADQRPTFADRQRSAMSSQRSTDRRNTILEDELTRQGLAAGDEHRALLRRWGETLTAFGRISAESLGRNVPSEAELAHAAVAELVTRLKPDGTYIEARYDAFRYEIRDACLAAAFGVTPDALRGFLESGQALPATRTPADQRALFDRLYASLPDNQSRGELWARYRETRGRLSAAQGGFEGFSHLPLTAGYVLRHTPETRTDGAIRVTATGAAPGHPGPGSYALESKGGGSYSPEQAGRYSDHLTSNDGSVVMADGVTRYDGVVYLFDNPSTAATAVRDLQGRHPRIFVAYVDTGGAVRWVPRTTGVTP